MGVGIDNLWSLLPLDTQPGTVRQTPPVLQFVHDSSTFPNLTPENVARELCYLFIPILLVSTPHRFVTDSTKAEPRRCSSTLTISNRTQRSAIMLDPHTAIHSSQKPPSSRDIPPETYLLSFSPLSPMSIPQPLKTTSVRSEAYLMLSNARSSSPKTCFVKTSPLPKAMKSHRAERGRGAFGRARRCLQFPLCI